MPVSATTVPSAPACITALRSASEYFRSPPRTRITDWAGPVLPAGSVALGRNCRLAAGSARAQQNRPHRLGGVRASRHQRLPLRGPAQSPAPATELACCQSRACPRKVDFAGGLMQLSLGGDGVRRSFSAQRHAALACCPLAGFACAPLCVELVSSHVAFTLPCANASPDSCETSTLSAVSCKPPSSTRGFTVRCSHWPAPSYTACPEVARMGASGCAPGLTAGC